MCFNEFESDKPYSEYDFAIYTPYTTRLPIFIQLDSTKMLTIINQYPFLHIILRF